MEEQVVRVLGHGTFGEALLIKKDNQYQVLKRVSMEKMEPYLRGYQEQEVAILRNVKHPNIVSYKGYYMRDHTLYLYMEYCEGGDMVAAIRAQKEANFPENTVKEWARQLASALQYIHEARVLHRDLKPANIFLSSDKKNLKLGDFGLARVLSDGSFVAASVLGTPLYWAPEIRSGGYDDKADMYSFGASLFHIAALTPPQPNKEVPATYSDALRSLITTLMSQSPEDRPSAKEVLEHPALAPPTPTSPTTTDTITIVLLNLDVKKYTLEVPASATISEVKDMIKAKHGFEPTTTRLTFRGKTLRDEHTLTFYNIKTLSTIQMVLSYKGGLMLSAASSVLNMISQ